MIGKQERREVDLGKMKKQNASRSNIIECEERCLSVLGERKRGREL